MINKVITSSVKRICVMDKYADTTAVREPLFTDIASAVIGKRDVEMIGSSYGISSKDFAPLHVEAIIKNLGKPHPADQFTIASPETAFPIGITRNTSSGTLAPMLQSAETSRQSSLSSLKQSFMRPSLPKIRTQDSQEKQRIGINALLHQTVTASSTRRQSVAHNSSNHSSNSTVHAQYAVNQQSSSSLHNSMAINSTSQTQ